LVTLPLLACPAARKPDVAHFRFVFEPDRSRSPAPSAGALLHDESVLQERLRALGTGTVREQDGKLVVEYSSPFTDASWHARFLLMGGRFELRIVDRHRFFDALPAIDTALRLAGEPVPPSRSGNVVDQLGHAAGGGGVLSSLVLYGRAPGEFLVRDADEDQVDSLMARPRAIALQPHGIVLRWGDEGVTRDGEHHRTLYALEDSVILGNDALTETVVRRDPGSGHAVVILLLTPLGSKELCVVTHGHVRDYLAIVMDGRVVSRPPLITAAVCGGSAQIDFGDASLETAENLAMILRSGPLPLPLVLVEEGPVTPR
jgi:hypothetical protein